MIRSLGPQAAPRPTFANAEPRVWFHRLVPAKGLHACDINVAQSVQLRGSEGCLGL
jgi:hypothetical protein